MEPTHHMIKIPALALLFLGSILPAASETLVRVSDFGAVPNDGICDADAIRAAVASVANQSGVRLVFEAGVYNLAEASIANRSGRLAMVHFWNLDNWVIEGAVDAAGDPATTLEMNLNLQNEVTGARHLDIRDCNRFEVRNLIIDQNPRMATAAMVTEVNRSTGRVRIEVLEGMPHFHGMASFSANNWDLSTGLLIPGPPVTIGTDASTFGTWSAVDGSPGSYTIVSTQIANLVSVGEGLSFHFNIVIPQGRTIDAYRCTDLVFENIFIYNIIGMAMGAGDNRNMTFRRFHIKPEGNSLAVGPRDGIHITRSTGRLLMDDVMVKGVRWDPIVSYKWSVPVAERLSDLSIRLDLGDTVSRRVFDLLRAGSVVHFWSGVDPTIRTVSEVSDGVITFTEPLDASVQAGRFITPGEWHWDEAIIRNSKIESNYGTAIVYQSDNLLVENSIFRNNSYSNIGLGPTSLNAGIFTRNIVIRNNLFEASTWESKYGGSYLRQHRGTITLFNGSGKFSSDQAYHRDILIEDNLFRGLGGTNAPAAIDIKLAKNVIVRNNRYVNIASDIHVDGATTTGVVLAGLGIARNAGEPHLVESMPDYLNGLQMVRFKRGPNAPVPAFEFSVDQPVTVFLAVHDRGTPDIPANWTIQPGKVKWRTSVATVLKDSVYRADFPEGQVQIPGHDGSSGANFGVPHMLFVAPQGEGELLLSPESFTYPSAPGIQDLDLGLYWSGDGKTPFKWAMQSGFVEGSALSMFEGWLINRRLMNQPFVVLEIEFPAAGQVRLSWPSDGLPHGITTVRATPDLTFPRAEWSILTGTLSHDGEQTIFEGGSFSPNAESMFFRTEISK